MQRSDGKNLKISLRYLIAWSVMLSQLEKNKAKIQLKWTDWWNRKSMFWTERKDFNPSLKYLSPFWSSVLHLHQIRKALVHHYYSSRTRVISRRESKDLKRSLRSLEPLLSLIIVINFYFAMAFTDNYMHKTWVFVLSLFCSAILLFYVRYRKNSLAYIRESKSILTFSEVRILFSDKLNPLSLLLEN